MAKDRVLAVVGATGLVGSEIINILNDRSLPISGVRLFASEDSEGEVYSVLGEEIVVERIDEGSFDGVQIALFATNADIAETFIPHALQSGATVIDNSSFSRSRPEVPILVAELGFGTDLQEKKHFANPSAAVVQLVPVLSLLQRTGGIKRVSVTTLEAVSSAGKLALDELWGQTLAVFNQGEIGIEALPHQIAFNIIPQVDRMMSQGVSKAEFSFIEETRRILKLPTLAVMATSIRVPVFHGCSQNVQIELDKELSPEDIVSLLSGEDWATVYPSNAEYPMPLEVANSDKIHVGRIRKDSSVDHGIVLWVVADNLRRGAALNMVQMAERLMQVVV
jgi:aspartate-semialdehyde dehydrogenase